MASKASAVWTGSLKEGKGTISTATGVLKNANYSFATRFEGAATGTTPEEMIAAAHASCFSMALGAQLGGAGLTPTKIETEAAVTLAKVDGGFAITRIALTTTAERSRRDQGSFRQGRGRRQGRLPDLEALREQHGDYAGREAGVGAQFRTLAFSCRCFLSRSASGERPLVTAGRVRGNELLVLSIPP